MLAGLKIVARKGRNPRSDSAGPRPPCSLLAIDEFASLHEQLTGPLRRLLDIEGGPFLWEWVVPAIVAMTVFVVVFLPFLRSLPRSTRRGLLTAGFLFVSGAIGMEMFAATFVSFRTTDVTYVLSATVEETLEMLGIAVFLFTLLAYIAVGVPDVGGVPGWWRPLTQKTTTLTTRSRWTGGREGDSDREPRPRCRSCCRARRLLAPNCSTSSCSLTSTRPIGSAHTGAIPRRAPSPNS